MKNPVHITETKVEIFTKPGTKTTSVNDFRVFYKNPQKGSRQRTPKHIHMVVDLLIKQAHQPAETDAFIEHLVKNVCLKVEPSPTNAPALQLYQPQHAQQFAILNNFGDYTTEFLLIVIELIQTQERTNYPNGHGHYALYKMLLDRASIYSIVSTATWR